MKKKLLMNRCLICFVVTLLMCSTFLAHSQVENPGKLYVLQTSEGNFQQDLFNLIGGEEHLTEVTNLRIEGSLSDWDISDLKLLLMYGPDQSQKALLLRLDLRDCTIPDNTLATQAFGQTSVKEILLPETVELIDGNALLDSKVEYLTIGKNTSIVNGGSYTTGASYKVTWCGLARLPKLKKIFVNAENEYLKVIDNVLYTRDGATLLCYPALREGSFFKVPDGTKEIATCAFMGNELLSEVDLNQAETVSAYAFCNFKKLKTIKWGTKLTVLGDYAFNREITEEIVLNEDDLMDIVLPEGLQYIGASAFEPTLGISSITVPSTVTQMGNKCFAGDGIYYSHMKTLDLSKAINLKELPVNMCYYANQLENVAMPKDGLLETIKESAFFSCSALKEIMVPHSVKTIERQAFMMYDELNPTQLERISIGAGIMQIDENAFAKLTKLKEFRIDAVTPPQMGNAVFAFTPCENAYLFVPQESVSAYEGNGEWAKFMRIAPTAAALLALSEDGIEIAVSDQGITMQASREGAVSLFDIAGKELLSAKVTSGESFFIPLKQKGVYILKFSPADTTDSRVMRIVF